MSWMNFWGELATSVLGGSTAAGGRPSFSGVTLEEFRAYMRELSEHTGIQIQSMKRDHVIFISPATTGEMYRISANLIKGSTVVLTAISLSVFPRGEVPGVVFEIMRKMNRKMQLCRFDVIDTDEHSVPVLMVETRPSQLNGRFFSDTMAELTGTISALDVVLLDRGLIS